MSGSEALGMECWDLITTLVDRLYEPDEQVRCGAVRFGGGGEGGGRLRP